MLKSIPSLIMMRWCVSHPLPSQDFPKALRLGQQGCKTQYIPPLSSVRIHIKTTATVWRCSVFHVLAVPGSSQGRRVKKETGIKLWHMIMLLMVSLIMVMLLNLLLLLLLELLNCWRLWWWYKRCRFFCYKWCWCCWFYYKCCWWCWCYYKCRLWCWCNCKCCW